MMKPILNTVTLCVVSVAAVMYITLNLHAYLQTQNSIIQVINNQAQNIQYVSGELNRIKDLLSRDEQFAALKVPLQPARPTAPVPVGN